DREHQGSRRHARCLQLHSRQPLRRRPARPRGGPPRPWQVDPGALIAQAFASKSRRPRPARGPRLEATLSHELGHRLHPVDRRRRHRRDLPSRRHRPGADLLGHARRLRALRRYRGVRSTEPGGIRNRSAAADDRPRADARGAGARRGNRRSRSQALRRADSEGNRCLGPAAGASLCAGVGRVGGARTRLVAGCRGDRARRADRAAAGAPDAAADCRRVGAGAPDRVVGAAFPSLRSRPPVLRPRGLADPAARRRHLDDRRRLFDRWPDAADGGIGPRAEWPVLPVFRTHGDRQGLARNRRQPGRRAPCRHPAGAHRAAGLHRRFAAGRNDRRPHRAGDDDVLRLRLHPRPEGLHRRDHRRPRQLSADGARRARGRRLRELRFLLEWRDEGRARLQPADSGAAAALLAGDARRRGRRGDRRVNGRVLRRAGVAAAIVLVALAPLVLGKFAVSLLNDIGIGALVALGLVLLTGIGGATSFGQAAFVGVAAYATAWLTTAHGVSPWLGLVFALALTGLAALAIGVLTLRLGGHYLPLSTIAWGISIPLLFGNLDALGRHTGLSGIPPLQIGPWRLLEPRAIYYLIWAGVGGACLFSRNLLHSRAGRAIRSLRGGATLLASVGADAFGVRLALFVTAALLAGF